MLHTRILIKEKKDLTPALPEVKEFVKGEIKDIVILEEGMTSGKTSICFHIVNEEGKSIMVETSAGIFEMVMSAIKGAEMRWMDQKIHNCARCKKNPVKAIGHLCDSCMMGHS